MEQLKAPCKDCKDRVVGCHSTCEKYIIFSNNRKEYLAMVADKKIKAAALNKASARRTYLIKKGKWS